MNYIKQHPDRLCRSMNDITSAGTSNPWKLLAAAVIYQTAVDCTMASEHSETYLVQKYGRSMRRKELRDFINGEWLEELAGWSNIEVDAIRVELLNRMERPMTDGGGHYYIK